MGAVAILTAARARIADRQAWTQHAYARDAMGKQVPPRAPQARFWCAYGSLEAERVFHHRGVVVDFLRRAAQEVHAIPVVRVNDDVAFGHAAVLAMYDRAIALAADAEAR